MIDENAYERIRNWFNEYTSVFCSSAHPAQKAYQLKVDHSLRVVEEISALACSEGADESAVLYARTAGLLHDTGRFVQYRDYGTFLDRRSTNHALLGLSILEQEHVLDFLDAPSKDLVCRTISYHNRPVLPREESSECLFQAKLLRDADKIDIWNIVCGYFDDPLGAKIDAIDMGLPDRPELSSGIIELVLQGRYSDIQHLTTIHDLKVLQMGWVFDLNFARSFIIVKERSYLERLAATLPDIPYVHEFCTALVSYVDRKIKGEGA